MMMPAELYLVVHRYRIRGTLEAKQIGVFSSKEKAAAAVDQCRKLPGFVDHPEGFSVEKFEIGKLRPTVSGARI